MQEMVPFGVNDDETRQGSFVEIMWTRPLGAGEEDGESRWGLGRRPWLLVCEHDEVDEKPHQKKSLELSCCLRTPYYTYIP